MTRSWVARSSRMRARRSGLAASGSTASIEQLLDGRVRVGGAFDGLGLGVGVDGVDEAADDVADRAAGDGVELGALVGGELELELGQAGGEGGGLVLGEREGGGLVEQLLERDGLLAVQRRVDEVVLGDADGVDDDEAGLRRWRRG